VTTRTYTIVSEPDTEEGGYSVLVPALPGCATQGETIEECIAMAREVIQVYLETLLATGQLVPGETLHPQAIMLDVPVPEMFEVAP
jgi:predicted RNase H-like HicB family nuclease